MLGQATGGCRAEITVLHLSDPQFGMNHIFGGYGLTQGDQVFDTLRSRLRDDLEILATNEQLHPDLVVVTGDLAETGMPAEFRRVTDFLVELVGAIGLTRDRVVIVPGNHDVNRAACEGYFLSERSAEREPIAPYWPKWRNFAEVFQGFYSGVEGARFDEAQPWTLFEVPALSVVVAGLNSTMAESHRESDHYGSCGEEQLRWFADRMRDYRSRGWLRLAAVHHNLRRDPEVDDENLRDVADLTRLLGPALSMVLHGHTHDSKAHWLDTLESRVPVLSTGSAAVRAAARPVDVSNQYQIVKIRSDGFTRYARRYQAGIRSWVADSGISANCCEWKVQCPHDFADTEATFRGTVAGKGGVRGVPVQTTAKSSGDALQSAAGAEVPAPRRGAPLQRWTPRLIGEVPVMADCYQDRSASAVLGAGLAASSGAGICQVLTGLGGVGKTQLAADLARRLWAEKQVDLLVWITADSRDAIVSGYAKTAESILGVDPGNAQVNAERLLAWLREIPLRWLIVLDDLGKPEDLRGLWPPTPATGRTVVTHRHDGDVGDGRSGGDDAALFGSGRVKVDVSLFTPEESREFLTAKLAEHRDLCDDVDGVANDVGNLPLALAQAAAYMIDVGVACSEYRRQFARQVEDDSGALRVREIGPAVAATWALSVRRANTMAPKGLARPLLEVASLLDPNGISAEVLMQPAMLHHLMKACGRLVTEDAVRDGLQCLRRLDLATIDGTSRARTVRVHKLIQLATRARLSLGHHKAAALASAEALVQAWPPIERDLDLTQSLIANATRLINDLAESGLYLLWDSRRGGHPVMGLAGRSLGESGGVAGAVKYFEQHLQDALQRLGNLHPYVLVTRGKLAYWRGEAGGPTAAVADYEQLLEDMKYVLGEDDPETLATRGHLAYWRGRKGDPATAEREFGTLLCHMERVLAPDDPVYVSARGNHGRWLGHRGWPHTAVDKFEELLDDQLRVRSPKDPKTLTTRHNLARWRGRAGDPLQAAADLAELLKDVEAVLGSSHLTTLAVRHNYARWRARAGDPKTAVTEFEQLLEARLRRLGPDHPDTLNTRHNLARWRGEAGDQTQAVRDYEGLLTDMRRVLGDYHPDTLAVRSHLARWRGEAGDPACAIVELKALLVDQLREFPADHPDTLATRHNLAKWRGEIGDRDRAIRELEELLKDQRRVLTERHPHTLGTRIQLARLRGEVDGPAAAVKAYHDLLDQLLARRIRGRDHLDTLVIRGLGTQWRVAAGDTKGAEIELAALLKDQRRVLGDGHRETRRTMLQLEQLRPGRTVTPPQRPGGAGGEEPGEVRGLPPDHRGSRP